MTGISRDIAGDMGSLVNPPLDRGTDLLADVPLGMVLREPLSSLLRTVRMPPPILNKPLGEPAVNAATSFEAPAEGRTKHLEATGLVLELAHLVLKREPELDTISDPAARQGFDEVCRFLLQTEHLRMMRQQS